MKIDLKAGLRFAMILGLLSLVLPSKLAAQTPQFPNPITINPDQSITYSPTPAGDQIPDFSVVGYNYGNSPLPDQPGGYQVPVLVTLSPGTGDQTVRIQAAINFISTKPLVNGFRGALLLKAGRWDIYSKSVITVKASGVVIRGEGDHPLTGTRIYAIGTTNENGSGNTHNSTLISFIGGSNVINSAARTLVDNVYVPEGTNVIPITGHPFTVNQRVQICWPGSIAWQKATFAGMGTADADPSVFFNRVITAVTPNSITLDGAITIPLDPAWGHGYVLPATAFNNITNVGISNCYFEGVYANDTDENHIWNAVYFNNVEDGFMHDCTSRYFAYALGFVDHSTRKITINRCQYNDGISILQGGRRYCFTLMGQMALVSNTLSRYGRHTYITNGFWDGEFNVFVDGIASQSYNESGCHARWNNGALWDNISTLNSSTTAGLQVKLERPSAYCVAWNCITDYITFEDMPLSPNWSFGTTNSKGGVAGWVNSTGSGNAPYLGKAEIWSSGTRMSVRSLYENQVAVRLAAANNPYRYKANLPTHVNYPPVIRTPSQLVALSGSVWSYQLPVSYIVPATKSPNYTVTGLPSGVSVNSTTGLISGTLLTVTVPTNYNLTLSARNVDGTTTKAMTLTVQPASAPKVPLTMGLEVDVNLTTPLPNSAGNGLPVPMVPASRLLAPMIVKKAYLSDINGTAYTAADIPVPVRAVLPIEGLTSPVTITYNGSTTLPTLPGSYNVVATLNDPFYTASANGTLLITNATAVTVTLGNTTAPTVASPVTATSSQPSIAPVITYDGSNTFPSAPGFYTAKAVVADPEYFGAAIAQISLAPQITQQPASLTVNQGSSASFSVTSVGGIASTYQWRKGGVAIPGATGTSFTIASTQGSDSGSYDVVVTDQIGVTTSATATLVVIISPQIAQPPASLSVAQGSPATFTVTATGGALSYQWRKGTTSISGATAASFTLPSVTTGDAGSYNVVVTNSQGTVTSTSATLTVVVAPQITQQPITQTVNQGTNVNFTVTATGIGNTYQWRKATTPIPGATGPSYSLTSAQASDAASYDVVVTNIAGSVTSNAVTLTVIVPPQITLQPASQVVTIGGSATFSVVASGISVTYQWRKGGAPISGANDTSHTIALVQTTDAGLYDVVVTNPAGSIPSKSASLSALNSSVILKLNNTTALDSGGSWTGGGVPSIYDTASWSGTYSSGSVSIGTGLSVGRLQLVSPSTAITINTGSDPLTLGGGGFDLSTSTQNLTVNPLVTFSAHQTWTVNSSRTLTLNSAVSDGGAGLGTTISGAGTTVLAANNTYTGPTTLTAGTLHLGATAGSTIGSVAGPLTITGGTLRSNRTDAHAPIGGMFSASAGTLQVNSSTGILTLNSTNLPAGSNSTLTTVTGTAGATLVIDAAPAASLGFGGSVAGMNLTLKNGAVNFTTSSSSFNIRVEGGSLTSTPTDRFTLATANQTFTVTGGTLNLTAATQYGFRFGCSGSANQTGAQNVIATQSGGSILATTLNLGGSDTAAGKSPSYAVTGGTLGLTSSFTIGADAASSGSASFTLGGSGKLLVPGSLSGSQASARQIFTMSGGTLAVGTANFTNLRSTDAATNGSFTQLAGTLAPGDVGTPGRTGITGNYALSTGGTLAVDLSGTTAASAFQGATSQYDNVTVTGATTLGGNLTVSLVNSFVPSNSSTFTILNSTGALTGAFANVAFGSRLITTGAEGSFLVSQVGNTVTLSAYLPVVVPAFVTPGATSNFLDWSGSIAVTYNLDRALSSDGPFTRIATGLTATTYTDTTIVPGTAYYYRLTGTDSLSRVYTTISNPPPSTPTGLAAVPGFTTNALSWNAVSGATGYRIKRALSNAGPFVAVGTVDSSTTTFIDTVLSTGTTYFYIVTAFTPTAESFASNITSSTPIAGTVTKSNNTTALDLGSSWSTGVVPTLLDNALWNSTYTNGTVGIGQGLSVAQLKLTGPSQDITIHSGTGPLTLGSGGFDLSSSTKNLTVNAPVILADNQTWNVNTGRTLTLNGTVTESNSETALTKSGAGTLVLNGTSNSWTGATSVNGGTLRLGDGAVIAPSSNVSVAAGATLTGTGIVQGPVTINGILAPGLNGAGTLSLQDSLTLAAGSSTNLSIDRLSPSACSGVSGVTAVTYGGTLTVTNVGTALAAGDRFVLLGAASYSGAFTTLNLPALSGLVWDTSGLSADGSIVVRSSAYVPTTKYWDTSATTGLQGGAGAWDTLSTTNWNPASDGSGTLTTFWHFDSVVFQTGVANTITLSGPIAVSALSQSVNGTATTLNGGSLILAGPLSNGSPSGNAALTIQAPVRINNLPVTLAAAQPVTLGQGLGGSGNITKIGASTLTITGDSDWTGALTLDGGATRFNGATPGLSALTYGSTPAATTSSTLQLTQDATLAALTVQNLGADTLDIAPNATLTVNGPAILGLNGNTATITATTTTSIAFTGGGAATFSNLGGSFIVAGGNKGGIVTADFSGLSALTIDNGPAGNIYLGVNSSVTNDTLRLAPATTLTAATFYIGDANTGGTYSLVLGSGNNILNLDNIYIGQRPGVSNRSDGSVTFPASAPNATLLLRAADGISRTNLLLNDNSSTTGRLLTTTFDVSGSSADLLLNNLVVGRRNASSSPAQLTNDTFRWDRGTLDVLQQVILSQAPAAAQKTHVGTMTLGSANSTAADTAIFRGGILVAENRSTVTTAGATAQATLTIGGGSITSAGITLGDITTLTAPTSGTRQSLATLNLTGGALTLTAPLRSGTSGGPGNETSVLNLNGGTLDLGGNSLGGTGTSAITTLNFQSGVLANVPSINGTSGLNKTGINTLTLAGTNTFTGPITVSNGTFVLAPSATASTSISVVSGAILTPAGSISGNLTLPTGATWRVRLNSATGYDQLVLTGANSTASLGGMLDLVAASDLPAGTRFRILRNQGNPATPVSGIFAGRANRILFTASGRSWYLDYAAGSGGDVDLVLASTLELWRQANFGTLFATGNAADLADPDRDGLSNLLEYAFGGNPNTTDNVAPFGSINSNGFLQISFNRPRAELTYFVQGSNNLVTWTNLVTNPGTVGARVTYIDAILNSPRFLRVKITSP